MFDIKFYEETIDLEKQLAKEPKSREYILNKKIGNTYIFDVRIDHEITPILDGERYSLLWFLQNEHIKIETNKLI